MSGRNDMQNAITLDSRAVGEPEWLKNRREKAANGFNTTPLPRRGLHLWRYTDPLRFMADHATQSKSTINEETGGVDSELCALVDQEHIAATAVDSDGIRISGYGLDQLAARGVIVGSLAQAARENERVASYLYELVKSGTGKFEALNGALWREGIFVFVPKGVVVSRPIYLRREMSERISAVFPRLLIVAEENSELTVIDDYVGGSADSGSPNHSTGVVELFGGSQSRIRYISMQHLSDGTRSYLTHRARIEQDANMLTVPLLFGGAECKQNFGIILSGEGAESSIVGLQFARGFQHFDTHTLHHHTSGRSLSNIDLKVVLKDKANSAYTGLIRIEKDAPDCQAYQTNRNLLLNSGCKAETIPELEILNEDVSCSHGATVGPVDPLSVFYLKCRGVTEQEAVRMIVAGFVEETLKMVPEDLQNTVREIVESRLRSL